MEYIITGLITLLFLAILIIAHEFGHFITAKWFKLRVDEFAFGFPPRIFSRKKGDTNYSLNALPFGGYVKIYGETGENIDKVENPEDKSRSFYFQPAWKRAIIVLAGVVMNFLVGWLAFSIFLFFVGIPQSVYVSDVSPNSPAAEAGFVKGDKISGFSNVGEFISFIEANAGKLVVVNGKEVTPRFNPPQNEGRLGIKLTEGDFVQYDLIKSLTQGFVESVVIVGAIFLGLWGLVAGLFTGGGGIENLTGPIGIVEQVNAVSRSGALYLIQFLGFISLNLAVFNLLPVPALDGGRFLIILAEMITGKRPNAKHETIAISIGALLLIALAISVTINDIYKLVS